MNDTTQPIRDLTCQIVALRDSITSLKQTVNESLNVIAARIAQLQTANEDVPAYIAGDKPAAAFLGISVPTFERLMRAQRVKPVRTQRGKLWRRSDLLALEGDDTTFAQNNQHPFATRDSAKHAQKTQ